MKFTFEVNDDLAKRFDLSLELTGENKDIVVESMIKAYVVQAFSRAASNYQSEIPDASINRNFEKAVRKIPKWASKPMLIPSKIIRAFLLLSKETDSVSYNDLLIRCSNRELFPDEYVATFSNNFAQMKFDDEKSHGKVFDVNSNQIVTLWPNIKEVISMNKERFENYSTAIGYINRNNQKNLGRTNMKGSNPSNFLYQMRCEDCLHEYFANGSDIHLKKCPACQGGADTGKLTE